MGSFQVIQGVYVAWVERVADRELQATLRDDDSLVGTVTWEFDSVDEQEAHAGTLEGWAADGTRLTYVASAAEVTLLDEERLLRRAFD